MANMPMYYNFHNSLHFKFLAILENKNNIRMVIDLSQTILNSDLIGSPRKMSLYLLFILETDCIIDNAFSINNVLCKRKTKELEMKKNENLLKKKLAGFSSLILI